MRVIATAQLHWLKGFDVLLEAAARAREPWSVRIVGDGPARVSLEAQADGLPPGRQVEFVGWQSDAAQGALGGHVVCAPSRAEAGPSYVVLEAMSCARPVVASDVDGAGEAIRDGEDGLLVPAEDPGRLAQALDLLARDPERRMRMGKSAYARAASQFQLTRMVRETASLYETAVSRRARGGRSAY